MNNNIKIIFNRNIELLGHIDKIIFYFRTQNYDAALRKAKIVINHLSTFVELILTNAIYFNQTKQLFDSDAVMNLLQSLLDAQENKDYILLADLYELQLSPFLINLQETIISKEDFVFDEMFYETNLKIIEKKDEELSSSLSTLPNPLEILDNGYLIEYTSCGLMTLAIENSGHKYYLHSNHKVLNEALTLVHSWYTENKSKYIVYGLGLGYHIWLLLEEDSNVTVEVYESDINIIQLACAFSDLTQILNNSNMKLYYDPDFHKLSERIRIMDKETEFVIHYPSLRNVANKEMKEKLENYFLQYSSVKNQTRLLNGNFKENIKNYDGFVDELKGDFSGKDLYIVAAGPSLDNNYMYLKERGSNSIILATGTVFRKLLNAKIRPDFFIVTDANARIYHQISGFETQDVPMLFLSTAYNGFAKNYQGKKYMICQQDYFKAEEFAREKGLHLYKTGGSVSTTALDIGISLGCGRIIFLGLDLAFTDNYVHASGTSRRNLTDTDDLKQVEDINGNLIYTSKSLDMYRRWIENRIKDVKDIEFLDATEGGAKVKGMKPVKLRDII